MGDDEKNSLPSDGSPSTGESRGNHYAFESGDASEMHRIFDDIINEGRTPEEKEAIREFVEEVRDEVSREDSDSSGDTPFGGSSSVDDDGLDDLFGDTETLNMQRSPLAEEDDKKGVPSPARETDAPSRATPSSRGSKNTSEDSKGENRESDPSRNPKSTNEDANDGDIKGNQSGDDNENHPLEQKNGEIPPSRGGKQNLGDEIAEKGDAKGTRQEHQGVGATKKEGLPKKDANSIPKGRATPSVNGEGKMDLHPGGEVSNTDTKTSPSIQGEKSARGRRSKVSPFDGSVLSKRSSQSQHRSPSSRQQQKNDDSSRFSTNPFSGDNLTSFGAKANEHRNGDGSTKSESEKKRSSSTSSPFDLSDSSGKEVAAPSAIGRSNTSSEFMPDDLEGSSPVHSGKKSGDISKGFLEESKGSNPSSNSSREHSDNGSHGAGTMGVKPSGSMSPKKMAAIAAAIVICAMIAPLLLLFGASTSMTASSSGGIAGGSEDSKCVGDAGPTRRGGGDLPDSDVIQSEEHLQVNSIRIARAVAKLFPEIKVIGGWRPNDPYPDHPSGRAVDIMIPDWNTSKGESLGDEIFDYLWENREYYDVDYFIWKQVYHPAEGQSNKMEDRGDPTQNHYDHIHVTSNESGFPKAGQTYEAAPIGGGSSKSGKDSGGKSRGEGDREKGGSKENKGDRGKESSSGGSSSGSGYFDEKGSKTLIVGDSITVGSTPIYHGSGDGSTHIKQDKSPGGNGTMPDMSIDAYGGKAFNWAYDTLKGYYKDFGSKYEVLVIFSAVNGDIDKGNLDEVIEKAHDADMKVVLVNGNFVFEKGGAEGKEDTYKAIKENNNKIIEEADYDILVDWAAEVEDGGESIMNDFVHPNGKGQKIVTGLIQEAVSKAKDGQTGTVGGNGSTTGGGEGSSGGGCICSDEEEESISSDKVGNNPASGMEEFIDKYAPIIVAVGQELNLSDDDIILGLGTPIVESGYMVLASEAPEGNRFSESRKYPHDKVLSPRLGGGSGPYVYDVMGLYQQRAEDGMGWGSIEEIMNPVHAAAAFFGQVIKYNRDDEVLGPPAGDGRSWSSLKDDYAWRMQFVQRAEPNHSVPLYRETEEQAKAIFEKYKNKPAKLSAEDKKAIEHGVSMKNEGGDTGGGGSDSSGSSSSSSKDQDCGAQRAKGGKKGKGDGGEYAEAIDESDAGEMAKEAVKIALDQRGKPYVWDTVGPDSFDCSGLVSYAYIQAGFEDPDNDGRILNTRSIESVAKKISSDRKDLVVGDAIITNGGRHVVLYIGDGKVVQAPSSGDVVKVTDVPAEIVAIYRFVDSENNLLK